MVIRVSELMYCKYDTNNITPFIDHTLCSIFYFWEEKTIMDLEGGKKPRW